MSIEAFFAYARERHSIYLRRVSSLPGPWTTDPILQQYRFTNVFRELDRTTVWYRENVREKLPLDQMLLATVVFRWFNRITTGEAIFSQQGVLSNKTVWELMDWSVDRDGVSRWIQEIRNSILTYCDKGPYVTGAYIIKTPDGMNKLDGVLKCIEWFMEGVHDFRTPQGDTARAGYRQMSEWLTNEKESASLESVWLWLKQFPFLGDFMAYEIVTDLRHSIMSRAPDIMTWANPGPGATRGLGRVQYNDKDKWNQHRDKELLVTMMQNLLRYSKDAEYWPQMQTNGVYTDAGLVPFDLQKQQHTTGSFPVWEMRDVEHTLCEFDKYCRVVNGEGRPRGRFQ